MKHIYNQMLVSLAFLTVLTLTTIGCSSDSDDDSSETTIEGIWKITSYRYEPISEGFSSDNEESDQQNDDAGDEENSDVDNELINISFPDEEGQQPYFYIMDGAFRHVVIANSEKQSEKKGYYSISGNEITITLGNNTQLVYGYVVKSKTLTLIRKMDGADEIYNAVLVSVDPLAKDDPGNGGNQGNGNAKGCAVSHNSSVNIGLSANPMLAPLNTDITLEKLMLAQNNNGFETRYYLTVEPKSIYSIKIVGIESDYGNVHDYFKYIEVSATDAFSTDRPLISGQVKDGDPLPTYKVMPSTSCLYIKLFSYEENVKITLRIDGTDPEQTDNEE